MTLGARAKRACYPLSKPKVLLICHNHPDLLVGGVEVYTRDLYEALQRSRGFEPVMLARAGRPYTRTIAYHPGSPFTRVIGTRISTSSTPTWRTSTISGGVCQPGVLTATSAFLLGQRPDVIHFQHTAFLGYDMVRVARNTLPDAPLVYSLHEYLPICHRDGQMVRTTNEEPCQEESPRRCHECFPDDHPTGLLHAKAVHPVAPVPGGPFIAPSEYVKERYADWGMPARRSRSIEGCHAALTAPRSCARSWATADRNRFAFFGQFTPYKGADVLLRAMDVLGDGFDGHL